MSQDIKYHTVASLIAVQSALAEIAKAAKSIGEAADAIRFFGVAAEKAMRDKGDK